MKKSHGKYLADFVEQRVDLLTEHLLTHLADSNREALRPLLNMWLANQIACYRNKPYRAGEWVSQTMEYIEAAGGDIGEAHQVFRECRNALIAYCLENVEGISASDIYDCIMAGADAHDAHLIEHCMQRMREQESAERRRCGMISDAVDSPLALLNAQGFIETANRAFARCLAVSPESLAGRDVIALCDEKTASRLRTALRHKSGGKQQKTFTGLLQEGKERVSARFHVQQLFDASGLRAGAALCLETKSGQNNDDVSETDGSRYVEECLLGVIPYPVQMVTEDGAAAYSSESIEAIAPPEYDGKEPLCCFLYKERHGNRRSCLCRRAFSSGEFQVEEICHVGSGETRWFLLFFLPVPERCGRITRVLCCAYDMTRRKQVQKQLETGIITQQRTSLTAQIAVTVAHQLRNPLSVVLGFAEMISKGLPSDQTHEAVTRILRNAVRCKDIVEDLLDFGKGMPLERRVVDFATLVRESVRPMLTPAQNRMITWRLPKAPVPIECVPEQLVQVVLSLVDNALRAAASHVVCALEKKGGLVRLRVMDDGPGIAPDLRERIFEPFFTTRRETGAVGLGLSLARAVANDYGGNLAISSGTGDDPDGACFVLQLPVLSQDTEASPVKKENVQSGGVEEAPAKRVLVVDDEADLLDLMKTVLYTRGYLADTVASGAEALEKLTTNNYDAAVIDFLLSGSLSGADVYEHISEHCPELREHVFFITADTMNYQTRLFLDNTGRPVLEKPFLMTDFISELQKATGGN